MDSYRLIAPQSHSEVTSFSTDELGTDIVFIQVMPRSELPAIARAVMPVDMVITRTQHFDPYDHAANRAKGTYTASIPRGPGRFSGEYFLTETDTGSHAAARQRRQGACPACRQARSKTCSCSSVKYIFDAEEAFTADWIAEHH